MRTISWKTKWNLQQNLHDFFKIMLLAIKILQLCWASQNQPWFNDSRSDPSCRMPCQWLPHPGWAQTFASWVFFHCWPEMKQKQSRQFWCRVDMIPIQIISTVVKRQKVTSEFSGNSHPALIVLKLSEETSVSKCWGRRFNGPTEGLCHSRSDRIKQDQASIQLREADHFVRRE